MCSWSNRPPHFLPGKAPAKNMVLIASTVYYTYYQVVQIFGEEKTH